MGTKPAEIVAQVERGHTAKLLYPGFQPAVISVDILHVPTPSTRIPADSLTDSFQLRPSHFRLQHEPVYMHRDTQYALQSG